MQTKLTLTVAPSVIVRAKRYARKHGTSVSQMVEAYLSSVTTSADSGEEPPPVLRSLLGTLRKAGVRDYKTHLAKKYL